MDVSNEEITQLLNNSNFPELKNDRIIKAALGQPVDKVPIWIMRQAGRYLPEFQELRKKFSFFEICQSPKLACEATLLPIRRYDLDAAIIFSDILVVPQALGMKVFMEKDKGPVFESPLTLEALNTLQWPDALHRLTYVGEAIRVTRHKLEGKVPIFGFSAAPWTLMCYMIEGGGTKTASKAKKWLYRNRNESLQLLKGLGKLIAQYCAMQIEYGAQMIQIFESSAEYLTADMYEEIMVPIIKDIVIDIKAECAKKNVDVVPLFYFAKGGAHFLKVQGTLGFNVISLDWAADVKQAHDLFPNLCLQGNLDPCALYADKEYLQKDVEKMMGKFGKDKYIVNLGHGIYPDAPVEAVEWPRVTFGCWCRR